MPIHVAQIVRSMIFGHMTHALSESVISMVMREVCEQFDLRIVHVYTQ